MHTRINKKELGDTIIALAAGLFFAVLFIGPFFNPARFFTTL